MGSSSPLPQKRCRTQLRSVLYRNRQSVPRNESCVILDVFNSAADGFGAPAMLYRVCGERYSRFGEDAMS